MGGASPKGGGETLSKYREGGQERQERRKRGGEREGKKLKTAPKSTSVAGHAPVCSSIRMSQVSVAYSNEFRAYYSRLQSLGGEAICSSDFIKPSLCLTNGLWWYLTSTLNSLFS